MSYQSNGRTGDSSALRRMNLQSVFRVLHSGGVHTITELTELAQLSRPTTRQAVDDLVASGWVVTAEAQRESASVGRPAQAFEFRPDAGFVLGADIGAAKAVVLISDLEGRVVARARATLSPTSHPKSGWRFSERPSTRPSRRSTGLSRASPTPSSALREP